MMLFSSVYTNSWNNWSYCCEIRALNAKFIIFCALLYHTSQNNFSSFNLYYSHIIKITAHLSWCLFTGTEKCFKQCEGHSWEIAPYFEPSPNGISFCYTMEDQLIVCKQPLSQATSKSTTTPSHDEKSSTVLYLDAGQADPDTRVNTNPGVEKYFA